MELKLGGESQTCAANCFEINILAPLYLLFLEMRSCLLWPLWPKRKWVSHAQGLRSPASVSTITLALWRRSNSPAGIVKRPSSQIKSS